LIGHTKSEYGARYGRDEKHDPEVRDNTGATFAIAPHV
jgi:hypothetical protein